MIGQKLGSFRLEEKIGAGAMGVVYRGVNEATGKTAAIKILSAEAAQRGNASKRFRREADILQQFRHPNIVRFLAVGRSQGTSYIAMEFIRGRTLDDVLEERGPLPWREVVDLGIQICEALQYTHERGVFHRDLKPSNLMVTADGKVKLTDFGIAKDEDATALTATGRTMGTAAYMAPEQIRGTPEISHKTDLYALGALFYQMLVGETPFRGQSAIVIMHAHLTEAPPRAGDKVEEIPRALDDLILQMMAKSPSDRPWDAAALGHSLTEMRDKAARGEAIPMVWTSDGTLAGPVPTEARPRPRKKKTSPPRAESALPSWAGTAGLVAALVALIGIGAYLMLPPGADALYKRAEALMASENPDDWRQARSEYLGELIRRFPNDPRRPQIESWLDRIALHLARKRAFSITNGLGGPPRPGAEEKFEDTRRQAEESRKLGRDAIAAQMWLDLATQLEGARDDRGWALLARERADERMKAIERRRREVAESLAKADVADRFNQPEEAARLREEVVKTYQSYPDLDDLVRRARAALAPAPSTTAPAEAGGPPG